MIKTKELARGFDKPWQARVFVLAIRTLAFFFPLSLFFVAGGFLPEQWSWMSSAIIILAGIATFLSELRMEGMTTVAGRFIGIAGLLFVVELVGSNTGYPFGAYAYTHALGLLVAGVPVAISVAWYCTVINAWRIAERLVGGAGQRNSLATALIAGLLALGLDIALEPMAGFVEEYWLWKSGAVPVQNYLSWFLLSSLVVYVLSSLSEKGRAHDPRSDAAAFRVAVFLFGFQFVLFFVTITVHGYFVEAGIALSLVASPFAFLRRSTFLHRGTARR